MVTTALRVGTIFLCLYFTTTADFCTVSDQVVATALTIWYMHVKKTIAAGVLGGIVASRATADWIRGLVNCCEEIIERNSYEQF